MKEFNPEILWHALDAGAGSGEARRYCVAYSGGLDSTVLLVALNSLAHRFPPGSVRAIHVHHGLHACAEAWATQCEDRCRSLGVPASVLRVEARAARGESPEASARDARYGALRASLEPGEVLLTAHHADDQLETVLIQLLRGAGVAGLAAMPADAPFGPGRHQRPLLAVPREALKRWALAQGLTGWIEDPANTERRFARNHLRHEVLPAIRAHWPAAAESASRTARHCAEAAGLLDELAALDLADCRDGESLHLAPMHPLSAARRRNLVRRHARDLDLPTPDERRLATLLQQLFEAHDDSRPEVRWPGVIALRHAGRLWLLHEQDLPAPPGPLAWPDPRQPLDLGPGLGRLVVYPTDAGGLRGDAITRVPWQVVHRRGGERLRLPGRAGSRALKKLLNAAGVPPWVRARMPLLEIDGTLAAVADLWVDAAWSTPRGTAGWRLSWQDCALPGREFIVGGQAF
jgi:tRNA(Ile)-lysidine synthase